MCLFEPAFIQFGQYIKSSSLFISNRWNIPLKRGSLYRTALYIFPKLYKSRFKLVHIYCTIEVIVLFHESKTGHSQSQVWTIFKVKNKSFLVKTVDSDYVQKVDPDCVQSFFSVYCSVHCGEGHWLVRSSYYLLYRVDIHFG